MGQFCLQNCNCQKHSGGFRGTQGIGRFCESDCTCKRHSSTKPQGWVPWNKEKTGLPAWGNGLSGAIPWNKGLTKESDARVLKNAHSVQNHIEICDGICGGAACGNRKNPSQLQWLAYDLLLKDFPVVIPEARFGRYSVDFLLAEEWLGIEIDGKYWHHINKTNYEERDEYLLEKFGLPIVRLTEEEIRIAI